MTQQGIRPGHAASEVTERNQRVRGGGLLQVITYSILGGRNESISKYASIVTTTLKPAVTYGACKSGAMINAVLGEY